MKSSYVKANGGALSGSRWNEHEAATYLNVSVATMRRWRLLNKGPKWIKYDGSACVRYIPSDVEAFASGRAA